MRGPRRGRPAGRPRARSCVTSSTAAASARFQRLELPLDRAARDRVERAEGLVHQDERRVRGERARHADALPLAARELPRPPAGELRGRQAHEREQLLGARAALRRRPAEQARHRLDVLAHRSSAERGRPPGSRSRCGAAGATGSCSARVARRRRAPVPRRVEQPVGELQGGRLAAAGRARRAPRSRPGATESVKPSSTGARPGRSASDVDELERRRRPTARIRSMAAFYDAVVIGGGPGGSTVATLARARRARASSSLEREKFPRFHVGESLLPFSLPIFDRLGVHDKIRAAGFQEKYGAFFWNEDNGTTRPVVFAEARDTSHPMAYQVKRAEFDDLLLQHAASCGAEVREETAVEDVLFEGGRAVGVRVRGARSASREEIRAQVVVDASGQGAVLSRKLGLRRFDPKLKRAALFAHYEGIALARGQPPGRHPAADRPTASGTGSSPSPTAPAASAACSIRPRSGSPRARRSEARYDELLARSPRMRSLLAGARRVSGVHGVSDYSARPPTKLAGDGWVLVGDAATFLDPVFSTGVFLALATGERAAPRDRPGARAPRAAWTRRDFAAYGRAVRPHVAPASGASCTASTIRSSSRPSARPTPPERDPRGRRRRRSPAASSASRRHVVLDAADVRRRRDRPVRCGADAARPRRAPAQFPEQRLSSGRPGRGSARATRRTGRRRNRVPRSCPTLGAAHVDHRALVRDPGQGDLARPP